MSVGATMYCVLITCKCERFHNSDSTKLERRNCGYTVIFFTLRKIMYCLKGDN